MYDACVQLRLPWAPSAPRAHTVVAGGRVFPVEAVRRRRARRYILRVTTAGTVRLTVPRGGTIAGGLAFASRQADWIAREWARRAARAAWGPGTQVWSGGALHAITVDAATITCGATILPRQAATPDLRTALQAHWRAEASATLPARCAALGEAHGLRPTRIVVRNQQSRWGSCSSRGSIALNWRLVQMPPEVADYVMLHELVHLEHQNHATRFWRRVGEVCPEWRAAERWLRSHGRDLL